MSFADDIADVLEELGEAVLLRSTLSNVQYDPITGEAIAPVDPVEITTMGYLGQYTATDVAGTDILLTDAKLILPKMSLRPQKGWFASSGYPEMDDLYEYFFQSVGSYTARIMSVKSVRMSAEDVVYICQLRAS